MRVTGFHQWQLLASFINVNFETLFYCSSSIQKAHFNAAIIQYIRRQFNLYLSIQIPVKKLTTCDNTNGNSTTEMITASTNTFLTWKAYVDRHWQLCHNIPFSLARWEFIFDVNFKTSHNFRNTGKFWNERSLVWILSNVFSPFIAKMRQFSSKREG